MCDVKKLKLHKNCSTPLEPSIVYIEKDKETIGVCEKCWAKIADKDWEIGNSPKPTMEDIFSDKSRLGDNPVETEYKERGVKNDEPSEEEEDF
jgi:hypothetical protein